VLDKGRNLVLKLKHGRPDEKEVNLTSFSGSNATSRRNLTDEQRAVVLGRLYNQLKLKRGRPDEKGEKFSPFSGSHATSRYIASLHGVSERTVRKSR